MKIILVSNDTFLCQELITETSNESYQLEVHENGLLGLETIIKVIPSLVIIDNDCDGINPLVLLKLISRDSRFESTKFYFITNKKIDNELNFKKSHNLSMIWNKPFLMIDLVKTI